MDPTTFMALALACAPQVHAQTAHALVRTESGMNPWAIGVVGGTLLRQPQNRAEALSTAQSLQAAGWSFSVGLAQINVANFRRLNLTVGSAFDPCANLAAMQSVLLDCFERAPARSPSPAADQQALRQALSCYYSGNFSTGFKQGYVGKVLSAAAAPLAPPQTGKPLSIPTTRSFKESSCTASSPHCAARRP
jgi:type IV secretion system protein VirB1